MNCIFCKIINNEIPSYTLYEDEYIKCFLDVSPKSNGHTLVIPKKHYVDINDIDLETLNQINCGVKKVVELINKTLNPKGIKIEQNNGIIQEVKHYHMHIVPIYEKNNKMDINDVYNELKKNC